MMPKQSYTRINTLELKALIVKNIGHHRAQKYFDQLTRLFSFKISKSDFDKFCIRIINRENIPLHNQLVRSIVKNACLAKIPPPKRVESNRDRKFRDRPSTLGPLGKPQSMVCEEMNLRPQEQQSATELLSLGSRPPVEVASVEDDEEVEQAAGSPSVQSRSPVTAPLGVYMNLGGALKSLSNVSLCGGNLRETCLNSGFLPDTRSLRSCLERKLEMEGMDVSVDCVN